MCHYHLSQWKPGALLGQPGMYAIESRIQGEQERARYTISQLMGKTSIMPYDIILTMAHEAMLCVYRGVGSASASLLQPLSMALRPLRARDIARLNCFT